MVNFNSSNYQDINQTNNVSKKSIQNKEEVGKQPIQSEDSTTTNQKNMTITAEKIVDNNFLDDFEFIPTTDILSTSAHLIEQSQHKEVQIQSADENIQSVDENIHAHETAQAEMKNELDSQDAVIFDGTTQTSMSEFVTQLTDAGLSEEEIGRKLEEKMNRNELKMKDPKTGEWVPISKEKFEQIRDVAMKYARATYKLEAARNEGAKAREGHQAEHAHLGHSEGKATQISARLLHEPRPMIPNKFKKRDIEEEDAERRAKIEHEQQQKAILKKHIEEETEIEDVYEEKIENGDILTKDIKHRALLNSLQNKDIVETDSKIVFVYKESFDSQQHLRYNIVKLDVHNKVKTPTT